MKLLTNEFYHEIGSRATMQMRMRLKLRLQLGIRMKQELKLQLELELHLQSLPWRRWPVAAVKRKDK